MSSGCENINNIINSDAPVTRRRWRGASARRTNDAGDDASTPRADTTTRMATPPFASVHNVRSAAGALPGWHNLLHVVLHSAEESPPAIK